MERTTIFLPPDLRRRLADESRRRRVPQAALVREALERYLADGSGEQPRLIGVASVAGVDARQAKAWVRERWAERTREH